jgi:hypothetical protein
METQTHMSNNIKTSPHYFLAFFNDGRAFYKIQTDDDKTVCIHSFPVPTPKGPLDNPEYFAAQKKIAEGIAQALNAAPHAAIAFILQAKREAAQIFERAHTEFPTKDID